MRTITVAGAVIPKVVRPTPTGGCPNEWVIYPPRVGSQGRPRMPKRAGKPGHFGVRAQGFAFGQWPGELTHEFGQSGAPPNAQTGGGVIYPPLRAAKTPRRVNERVLSGMTVPW